MYTNITTKLLKNHKKDNILFNSRMIFEHIKIYLHLSIDELMNYSATLLKNMVKLISSKETQTIIHFPLLKAQETCHLRVYLTKSIMKLTIV